jgi:hypothetical protein
MHIKMRDEWNFYILKIPLQIDLKCKKKSLRFYLIQKQIYRFLFWKTPGVCLLFNYIFRSFSLE